MSDDRTQSGTRNVIGAVTLYLGLALMVFALLDAAYVLPFDLPRTWYLHRTLWGGIGLALAAAGWRVQRPSTSARWAPRAAGKRFRRLVVYSRADCHLCDDAKATLAQHLDYLPDIEEVDIDSDPALAECYGTSIPVVELDGREYFRGRVDENLLRRLIDATPPGDAP